MAGLLLAAGALPAEIRTVTILHTNDLHARLSPLDNGHGGFAYLLAAVKRERDRCADCIFLNAGDLVQGTPVSTIFRGEPVYELANLFGFDAATLGNHEFDYGWAQTRKFLGIAKYPIVSANVVNGRGELLTSKAYVILRVNGLRIAVIGGITDSLKTLSTPKLLGDWHVAPVFAAVRKLAAELRSRSDLIVLLGHIDGPEEQAILHGAPEIPVLVTGHVHTGISQAMTYDGRVAVRVKSYGEELGRLELKVDTVKKAPVSWSWKRIVIDSRAIAPDAEMARGVARWEGAVAAQVDPSVGYFQARFRYERSESAARTRAHGRSALRFRMGEPGRRARYASEGSIGRTETSGNIMPFDNEVLESERFWAKICRRGWCWRAQDRPRAAVYASR